MAARKPTRRRKHTTQPPPLTAQQVRFCQLYHERGNATRAYVDAGFAHKNETVAASNAYRLLRNAQIREYIRHLQHTAAAAARLTVEEIAAGVAAAALFDFRKLYDSKGKPLPPHRWPPEAARLIEAVETDPVTGRIRKVKVAARMTAWAKLMEWQRMTGGDRPDPAAGGGVVGELVREIIHARLADRADARTAGGGAGEPGPAGGGGPAPDVADAPAHRPD